METHHIHPELLKQKVRVLVVGCGGTETPWRPDCRTCSKHCWHTVILKEFMSHCSIQTLSLRLTAHASRSVNLRSVSINLWFWPTA